MPNGKPLPLKVLAAIQANLDYLNTVELPSVQSKYEINLRVKSTKTVVSLPESQPKVEHIIYKKEITETQALRRYPSYLGKQRNGFGLYNVL
jgi:hypothetical protein